MAAESQVARKDVKARPATGPQLLAGVILISVGIPVLIAVVSGSISVPHNDAWSHARIAQHWAAGEGFRLLNWNRTALVGQIVVLGPLAASMAAQQLFVALMAVIGLIAVFAFLRARMDLPRALLGCAVVGAVPEFGLLATSYMSDIPAFAATMASLALGDAALRRRSHPLLMTALTVGLWAVTIREQALVAPVAVLVLAWGRFTPRWKVLGLGALTLGATAAFEVWRRSLPLADSPLLTPSPGRTAQTALLAFVTLAFLLSPALALVARPVTWNRRTRLVAVAVLCLVAAWWYQHRAVLLGNYFDPAGAYATSGPAGLPFWTWVWPFIDLGACIAAALLAGVLLSTSRPFDRLCVMFGTLLVAGTLVQALVGQPIYARYLLTLLPVVLAVILPSATRVRWGAALAVQSVVMVLGLGLSARTMAYDAARWDAARELLDQGVPATDIDAGLEWVGYHSPVAAGARGGLGRAQRAPWYLPMFPDSRQCYLVTPEQRPAGDLVSTYAYRPYVFFGRADLQIYRVDPCL